MHLTLRKSLIFIGKLVVSAAMLWFVFSNIETDKILQMIRTSNPWWLLAGTVLFILSKIVSAFRLNLFFRCAGLILPTVYNLRLYLLGMFYNLFLPGGVGGDAYKVMMLKRSSDTKLRYLIQATLLDRITGLIALVIITLILLLWLPLPAYIKWFSAASLPVIWIFSHEVIRRFFNRFLPIFLTGNLQSAAVQILQLGTAWCILWAIGYQGPVVLMLVLFLVSSVMAVIPVTFGGAGAREFTFALAATFLAFDTQVRDSAITLGLVFYLITAVVSLAGLWYVFVPPTRPPALSSGTSNSPTVHHD